MDLQALIRRARTSGLSRWWLNSLLHWKIPFNQPHGFRVEPLRDGGVKVHIPYWRINRNHIKGIHACCLATAAEYCSGLALLEHLDAKKYRLIMKSLHMDYHYQAKADAHAVFAPGGEEIAMQVIKPLKDSDAVLYVARVELHDTKANHLATGLITWQVKAWEKVRTKA
jgi:acyl-coenzyme A thioesterase PaaI-like protein